MSLLRIDSPQSDRGTRLMTLTAKGNRVMRDGLPHLRAAQNGFEAALSAERWPVVLAGMRMTTTLG